MYIDNLVELHSHIIPAVDDGSKNIETSLKMIEKLQNQGAKKIVLTPHYYSDEISLDDFLRRRDNAFNALLNALPPGSPTLIPAAEVYISKYLFNYDNLNELCIGNSSYALIEHPFSSSFDENDYNRLMNLYCDYGIKPVLAHIERYRALMEDQYILDEYIDMGCLTQVNINSFSEAPRSIRKKLFKLLDSGHIHFIGSDCHNLDSRPPEYEKGIKAIIKKCGEYTVDRLINNANLLTK
ncbi:MAG: tyrosine-protein phosphatase [Eubacterium sp.]